MTAIAAEVSPKRTSRRATWRNPNNFRRVRKLGLESRPTDCNNIARWYRGWGRYTQADSVPFSSGVAIYGYALDAPTAFYDPLGLYAVKDDLAKNAIGRVDVRPICKTTDVACTQRLGASVSYGCGDKWHPTDVTLYIRGQIYAYSGDVRQLSKVPLDRTVKNFGTAVRHEHAWHIDIAKNAVDGLALLRMARSTHGRLVMTLAFGQRRPSRNVFCTSIYRNTKNREFWP